jgi:NAD(P)H-hydrate epimerase
MSIPVISIAQMREWERASWAAGKSEAEVIRRVGQVLAQEALRLTKPGDAIAILAGKGHNGDDARCAREHLTERHAEILEIKDAELDFPKLDVLLLSRLSLVIDGLFGIGINRPLDAKWIKVIERINAAQLPVLAVDVPSGLNADSGEAMGAAIEASVTLTVGAPKAGMLEQNAWKYVGRLEVADRVGLIPLVAPESDEGGLAPRPSPLNTRQLNWTMPEDFRDFPPRRPVAGHKGTFGHLAIVAGSVGYHGAAVLAARGAQRAQPGLITLFTQEHTYYPVASQLQSVMVQKWSRGLKLMEDFSAVVIGPGLASPKVPKELKNVVRRLWRESEKPVVVDASALAWLEPKAFPKNAVRAITPHPGEAARLLKSTSAQIQADRPAALREISRRFGNTWVVLKGHQTLVGRSDGDLFINSSGNPFLGQGGSGDTLSGYLAGLLAQHKLQKDPLQTIRFAVWQHGATADMLSRTRPNWVVEDLLETLGLARPN